MTVVVNFLAGPGAGKSTLSYGLASAMKGRGLRVELVQEYAKELTWRRDWKAIADQQTVTSEQDRRLRDLLGHVDYIIQDTALPLGLIYVKPPYDEAWFERRVWELFEGYRNYNVFVNRVKPYETTGRTQTEAEAVSIDAQVRALMAGRIDIEVLGSVDHVETVMRRVLADHPVPGA